MGQVTKIDQRDDAVGVPHSIEAEQQYLGALITDNARFFKDGVQVTPEAFYEPAHALIYSTIRDRINDGLVASPVTLAHALQHDPHLAELGGPKYLVRLAGAAISSFAIKDYAQIIRDNHGRRRLLDCAKDIQARIQNGADPAVKLAGEMETFAGGLMSETEARPLVRSYLASMTSALREINEAYSGEAQMGVGTGLPALDDRLGLLRPTNLIILAGRTSMGKTSVAQNIAYAAARSGTGVFFASLEMSGEELGKRFLSKGLAERGHQIEYNRMIKGRLSEDEMRHVVEEARRQQALPITVGERSVRQISRLRSAARRAQQAMADTAAPLGLILVDYVQRVDTDKPMPIRERITAVTDALKTMAMDFNVPVVAMAQLNREVERRDNKRPMLSDLKESGSLEEDADVVLFCYRHAYYLQKEIDALNGSDIEQEADLRAALERTRDDLEIIIGKQRSGDLGTVKAFIKPGLCHITEDRAGEAGHLI